MLSIDFWIRWKNLRVIILDNLTLLQKSILFRTNESGKAVCNGNYRYIPEFLLQKLENLRLCHYIYVGSGFVKNWATEQDNI